MPEKVNYNPDILSCLANLSSDEVFTPPEIANAMLDMLPQELFRSPDTKFLDPGCKSGVFLREIAKRLNEGLTDQIPDVEQRMDHIMKNQLFAIAITQITALLSRRSVYCSKDASSQYSVVKFNNPDGNIRYKRIGHTWIGGKCSCCGASQEKQDRGVELESHAYEFIHMGDNELKELKEMKFDVVIGNPPYQLGDSGAFASASPIYHLFVTQAKKLNPRFLVMITPSRWFAGGKGLDQFREMMLEDNRIRVIHDYPMGSDCFPGTRIAGGVSFFKWDRDNRGECDVYSHKRTEVVSQMTRPLLENGADSFIRINEAVPILRKIQKFNEESFSSIVSPRKPFGLASDFFSGPEKYNLPPISTNEKNPITIIGTYKYKTEKRYVDSDYPFPAGKNLINKYKVFVSQVLDAGFDMTKERLKPFIGYPGQVCTETFLIVGEYDSPEIALNVISYMSTNFFHLLMHLKKVSHHVTSKVYGFVPMQDFSRPWTDKDLYEKYGLSNDEVKFVESVFKPDEEVLPDA